MFSAMEKVCVGSLVAEGRTAIIPRFMFWAGQKRFSQWERLRDHQQRAGSSRRIQLSLKVIY